MSRRTQGLSSVPVLVLAGGLGLRFRSVYSTGPKPMADVCGEPFLARLVASLSRQGFTDLVFLTGYKSDAIERYFGDGQRLGVRIRYSVETSPLGTGGALRNARQLVHGRFCVLNGDTWQDINPKDVLAHHSRSGAVGTVTVAWVADARSYGTVDVDDHGWITAFREKQASAGGAWVNAGLYVFEPNLLDAVPARGPSSLELDVLPAALKGGERLAAYRTEGGFIDFGTPEGWAELVRTWRNRHDRS